MTDQTFREFVEIIISVPETFIELNPGRHEILVLFDIVGNEADHHFSTNCVELKFFKNNVKFKRGKLRPDFRRKLVLEFRTSGNSFRRLPSSAREVAIK